MKRLLSTFFVLTFCIFSSLFAQTDLSELKILPQAVPEKNHYVMVVNAYDWGAAIDKAVISLNYEVTDAQIATEDFSVSVTMNRPSESALGGWGFVTGSIPVTDAFLSDGYGNPLSPKEKVSRYVTLLIKASPHLPDGDPFFHGTSMGAFESIFNLKISNSRLGLTITDRTALVSPLAGQFSIDEVKDDYVSIKYAHWEPEGASSRAGADDAGAGGDSAGSGAFPRTEENTSIPLILWFHTLGEGGSNPYVPLLSVKVTNLISEKIQSYFPRGAAVVVPQVPDSWLVTTTKGPFGMNVWAPVDTKSIKESVKNPVKKFLGNFLSLPSKEEEGEVEASVSYYTAIIKKLISEYLASHPQIDPDRVYVGGASAGGYMTVNMAIQAPELFAAAFPICENYPDSKITRSDLEKMAGIPLWFTASADDETVNTKKCTLRLFNRLKDQGAENIHLVLFDHIFDSTGLYFNQVDEDELDDLVDDWLDLHEDDEGFDEDKIDMEKLRSELKSLHENQTYQYPGHHAWIPVLNDECEEDGLSLFAWLSKQKRKN